VTPGDALRHLMDGNERFVRNVRSIDAMLSQTRRGELTGGQRPIAVVLACSDARVPAETVFDCGLGELFVVRVAGNVVAPSIVGSIEFAVSLLGPQLVLVMGHTQCGAIGATLDVLAGHAPPESANIADIVSRISPAITELHAAGLEDDALSHAAVRANIRASAGHLRHGSPLLERRVLDGDLWILGAEYDLASGRVVLLDDPPSP
jgi:carbonic anhydrase